LFQHLWSGLNRLIRTHPASILLTLIILYLIGQALSGLVANTAYNGAFPPWSKPLLEQVAHFITANFPIITIIISIIACWELISNMQLRKTLETTRSMVELDGSLLRLLAKLIDENEAKSEQDLQIGVQYLLEEFLRDATRTLLGDKDRGRAAIFCPGAQDRDHLEIMTSHRIPTNSLAHANFYVGNDENRDLRRGTVGVAFQEMQIHVGHIEQKKDYWRSDDDNFINFDENFEHPPYKSYVHVPITITSSRGDDVVCLGILHFDCQNQTVFDSKGAETILNALSQRIAIALLIYRGLLQSRNQPTFSL